MFSSAKIDSKYESLNHEALNAMMDDPVFRESYEEEAIMLSFSMELARIMEEKNWNNTDLAKELGISKGYVTQLLKGVKNVSLRTVARVLYRLGRKLPFDTCGIDETPGEKPLPVDSLRMKTLKNGVQAIYINVESPEIKADSSYCPPASNSEKEALAA